MHFRFYFFVAGSLVVGLASAHAQNAPVLLEGTLSQTRGEATISAKIWAQAPDKLRVETPDSTLISSAISTQIFEKATRRLRVYRWGIGAKWSRGAALVMGGPANFALLGTAPKTEIQTVRDEGAIKLVRDTPLFGGGGKNAFYAARKTPVAVFPARVDFSRTLRAEFDASDRETARYTLEFSGDLPRVATLSATRWNYDLKPRDAAPDASLWTIEDAKNAVPEAAEVGAPALYRDDAFNRAIALWTNAGDLRGALAQLELARAAFSQASAPLLARFEIEMALRDAENAEKTVAALEKLGLETATTETLRSRVFALRRDFAGAQRAAQNALKAAPDDPKIQSLAAFAARENGDVKEFRRLGIAVLQSANAAPELRASWAVALAQNAAPSELETLEKEWTGEAEPLRLARALLKLRAQTGSGAAPDAPNWSLPEYGAAWALALSRAGRDDAAKTAWESLGARPELERAAQNRAQSFLLGLAARRGDVAASLAALRAQKWDLESEKESANTAFFEAWQKAFKRLTLEKALENRATATRASEEDARLLAAYSAAYETPEERERALEAAATRFNSAFFSSKLAEIAASKTTSLIVADPVESAARDRYFARAFSHLDAAIRAEPKQPFYRIQRALVASHRFARLGASDAARAVAERDSARREIEALLTAFPEDADAKLAAAVASLTFDGRTGAARAANLARDVLESSGGDGERTTFIFAARQTLAAAHERLGEWEEAAKQFEILLEGTRSAGETAQLAGAYFDLLDRAGEALAQRAEGETAPGETAPAPEGPQVARMAQIGVNLVRKNWPFEEAKLLTDALARRLLFSPSRFQIMRAVRDAGGESATLLWATMAHYRLESARNALTVPGAPPTADAEEDRATSELNAANNALVAIANGNSPMAARAAAFLAERGELSPEDGARWLRRAASLEPRDLALQFSLLEMLGADEKNAEFAATLRREIATKFDLNAESARQLGLLAWSQNDDATARILGEESYQQSALSPEIGANAFQRSAFSLAKILASTQNTSRANELYGQLASEQWGIVDRAAALLAQRQRVVENGGDGKIYDDRIRALGLDLETLEQAAEWMVSVEN